MMAKMLANIFLLGLGYMLIFTSFQTMVNCLKVVLESVELDDPNYHCEGYFTLAVLYGVFACCNWFAPPIESATGPRLIMAFGGLMYSAFVACHFFEKSWVLYLTSAIMGFAAAITWKGHSVYLRRCSTATTMTLNSGVFYTMLQLSLILGNLYVYFKFQGKSNIDKDTRTELCIVLTVIGLLGAVCLALLQRVPKEENEKEPTVLEGFKSAGQLFITPGMLLLSVSFIYTGLVLSFYSGIYSPSVAFTRKLDSSTKELVGLSGICIGVGQVIGGLLFGIIESDKATRMVRNMVSIFGFIIHIIAFSLIYLNLPNDAPFDDTDEVSFFETPKLWIALLCAGLLGFGDACFNTQVYSMLIAVFTKDSIAAFAIFQFIYLGAAAISFAYASYLGLHCQIYILVAFGFIATILFCLVESVIKKEEVTA